jgi:hypothetical protein
MSAKAAAPLHLERHRSLRPSEFHSARSHQLANRKQIEYHRTLIDEVPLHRRGLASSIPCCSAVFYGT